MQPAREFQAFLEENTEYLILTLHRSQCMIAENITKNFIIMRPYTLKQINRHKYLSLSNGLRLSPFYNSLQGTDIIELRLEGP